MTIYKILIKSIFTLYLVFFNQATAIENKILFKVNNQIITSIDLLNEINYLGFINSEFENLKKQKIYEVSKNSLIREKIKEIELNRVFKELKLDQKYLTQLIDNYSKKDDDYKLPHIGFNEVCFPKNSIF